MNQIDFLSHIKKRQEEAHQILTQKNSDYANSDDPFRNFRNSVAAGVPLERGILVRVMDKITRVSNLLDKEAAVKDESITDSLLDIANYCLILEAYLIDKKKSLSK